MQTPSVAAPELNLLFPWPEDQRSDVWRWSLISSVALHLILFFAGLRLQSLIRRPTRDTTVKRTVTPLYLPPDLLTQKAPNKRDISKSFDLSSLLASQQAQRRIVAPASGSVRRLQIQKQSPQPAKPQPEPAISAEPPRETATNQVPAAGLPDSVIAALPTAPAQAPTPTAGIPQQGQSAHHIAVPKNSVQDVIRQIERGDSNSSTTVITDQGLNTNLPAAPGPGQAQGSMNSAIELKTDPQGADFKPYLREILAIVRRNWFSVLPESARAGVLRGSTTIQFIINKDGSIPKLVVSDSSGAVPLDRAAIAGLSMSNPLPPLPADFKGGLIKLQFSFNYNIPR